MTLIKLILPFIFVIPTAVLHAQVKAVSETGDEVYLYENGTWKYVEEIKNNDTIVMNPLAYAKPTDAGFLLKSTITNAGFWVNTKLWNFERATDLGEYSFSLKGSASMAATVITEAVGMDLTSLRKFAISNIQKVSSSFKILKEEYRTVNGLKVLMIQCEATLQGIELKYDVYYYTDKMTTIQFLCYAPKNLPSTNGNASEELLNGLVMLAKNSSGGKSEQSSSISTQIQSSLVANSDCKKVFKGTWSYVAGGKKYHDKIEEGRMMETNLTDDKTSEYIMNWLDNCRYELILVRSNDPLAQQLKMGAPMTIEIVEIDDKKMRYQLTYGKSRNGGEMKREL